MKTQQECWQALIDGETLVHCESGNEYRMIDGRVDGPHGPISFANAGLWRIKPRKLPFCDALRALVAGECKEIVEGSVCLVRVVSRDGFIQYANGCPFNFSAGKFDHEWELIK